MPEPKAREDDSMGFNYCSIGLAATSIARHICFNQLLSTAVSIIRDKKEVSSEKVSPLSSSPLAFRHQLRSQQRL